MSYDLLLSNGDIEFDEFGKLKIVEDEKKLAQSVEKIIYESQGDNLEDFNYGTIMRDLVGSSGGNGEVIRNQAIQSIEEALTKLQQYQQIQQRNGQYISNKEMLKSWANLTVWSPSARELAITGDVYNNFNQSIPLSVTVGGE